MPRHNGHSSSQSRRYSGDSIEHLLTSKAVTESTTPRFSSRLPRRKIESEQRRREEATRYFGRWVLKSDALCAITAARERLMATVGSFVSARGLPGFVYIAEHQLLPPGTSKPSRNGNVLPAKNLEDVRAGLVRWRPTAERGITVYGRPHMFIKRGSADRTERVALALSLTADREAVLPPEPLDTEAAFVRTRYAADIPLEPGKVAPHSHTIILIGTTAFREDGTPPLTDLLPPILAVPLSPASRGGSWAL